MKEAEYYIKQENKAVKCLLCPHECVIQNGYKGICQVRINKDGKLYSKTYNQLSSIALDPIEKKPLSRFKPGSQILSVGTYGCNFKCDFCQNYYISQMEPALEKVTSDELLTLSNKNNDNIGIAFTYNEPTVWYEYVKEVALKNTKDTVLVTNGYINEQPLKELLPFISAMNIDIKSINPHFYQRICNGKLDPVKETIKTAYEQTHVELTFLAIPDVNDSLEEMTEIAKWIKSINKDIPLHIIPFRPMYKMNDVPYQTLEKIEQLKAIAGKSLSYIY